MTLKQYAWRLFVLYNSVTLVICILFDRLTAWAITVLLIFAVTLVILWMDTRWKRK